MHFERVLGIGLLRLGSWSRRARLQQAHARAHKLTQPMARLAALWFDALFEVRLGNAQRVAIRSKSPDGVRS